MMAQAAAAQAQCVGAGKTFEMIAAAMESGLFYSSYCAWINKNTGHRSKNHKGLNRKFFVQPLPFI